MNGAEVQRVALDALARYQREARARGRAAWMEFCSSLADLPEAAWLTCAQRLVLLARADLAMQLLGEAHARLPGSDEVALALSGLHAAAGREGDAETLLREVLARNPGHAAAAFALAGVLRRQARTQAAAQILCACFLPHRHDPERVIQALELLDEMERTADAAAVAEAEIAAGCDDPRIHAYAATYLMQIGVFERARERYLFACAHSPQAPEWDVPFGLASTQRYRDASHPDFERFRACAKRGDLSPRARATLLFGMGKACADVGDFSGATLHLRQANEIAQSLWPWSRKQWRRGIEARLQALPLPPRVAASEFAPIFVVGVPRSGTTLAAELLSRYPGVCNRGESPWIGTLRQRLPPTRADSALLDALAREYERQLRQDDAAGARWFIDKQPLNLLHVGFMLALFPQAKVVACVRNARDNALSLWTQFFRNPDYGFAYDFADIAALQQGCERLLMHWKRVFPDSVRTLQYEEMAATPVAAIAALAEWIGLPPADVRETQAAAVGTASLWQVRQPVYTSSVGRWREWAPHLPELLQFSDR